MQTLITLLVLALGIWQLWVTKGAFTDLKKNGNEQTSYFIMNSLWSSLVMGIIFIIIALILLFGLDISIN